MMEVKTCMECDYHKAFFEEDGESDGCVCDHKEGSENYHINNCIEYVTNGKYKGCPYFKEEE